MDTSVDSAARSSSSLLPMMPSWNSELASPVTLVLTHVTGEAEMILTTAAHVRGTPLPFPCSYSSDLPGTVASESPESTEANLACKDLCSKRLKVDYTCHIIYYAIGHPVIRRSMDSTSQGKTMVHFFFKACWFFWFVSVWVIFWKLYLLPIHGLITFFNHLSKYFDMTGQLIIITD